MRDLISRQAAIRAVSEACFELRGVFGRCADAIRALPSAQPEVIRCKYCKHLFDDNKCPLRTWWTHTEDDFCSYAERRTWFKKWSAGDDEQVD